MRKYLLLCFLILLISTGCAPRRRVIVPPPPPPKFIPPERRVQYGWASWYGEEFHGRRTASGEIYDMYELTAAHRTLPFGTRVMVTHMRNGRSVTVTINDRGPFVKDRIIDLSYAAARILKMVDEGVAWVRVEVLSPPYGRGPAGRLYAVQVGAFALRVNALRLRERLKARYDNVYITVLKTRESRYWRVRVGPFPSRLRAEETAGRLAREGFDVIIVPH